MKKGKTIVYSTILMLVFLTPALAPADQTESPLGPPPGSYKILSDDRAIRIPFEIFRDEIRMVAEVNGRKVRMLIDNGYLWDQLLFFGSPLIDSLNLLYEGDIDVGGAGEGDPVKSKTASGVTISFPAVEFFDQTAIVTPYSSGLANLWEGAEGQVSAAFFKHFVVDVDFDESVISLIEPDVFVYTGGGREVPMLPLELGAWGIPCEMELADGTVISQTLMLDLGLNDALWLVTGGVGNIPLPDETIETSLGFGVEGEIKGHVGRIRSVEIGGYKVSDVLAGFRLAEEGDSTEYDDVMIGFALLSQFNVTFDYPGRRLFLEPNKRHGEPLEFDMSGLDLRPARGGGLAVERIIAPSPASEAGMEVGDLITRINGRPVGDYKIWELDALFRQRDGRVTLDYRRGGEKQIAVLTLRRLI